MAVAIKTVFLAPTNYRPARVKAMTMEASGSGHKPRTLTLSWDHALDGSENHAEAAKALVTKLGWTGDWHMADGGDFYVWMRTGAWSWRFALD